MNTKDNTIKLKKIPYYLLLTLLTAGASLILGFLSFGGMYALGEMYALDSLLALSFTSFALSVAYEGEIYLQNLKGAFNKLFKTNYLKNYLAKEYLLEHFPKDCEAEDCPQFFKDYDAQLKLLSLFDHKALTKESRQSKRQIDRTLKDMEKWFASQLFSKDALDPDYALKRAASDILSYDEKPYAAELAQWLEDNDQKEAIEELAARSVKFALVKIFSLTAGFFMTLGTTYLIVEAFSVIPFFATIPFTVWPVMILPMAVIAGTAYGMLTFNAVTDLVNNNTLVNWYYKLRDRWNDGFTLRNVIMIPTAVSLVLITLALTIFTAGTWWTVATNARPLFDWMKNMPKYIMGVINPIIIGFSAASFNLENMAESMDMVDEELNNEKNLFRLIFEDIRNAYNAYVATESWLQLANPFRIIPLLAAPLQSTSYRMYEKIRDAITPVLATENWLQIANPFRIIRLLTITPLRIILFLGHLVSIALTADRMPGVPQIVAALTALISEGFEDAHYFVDHDEEEHCHHPDQPHNHTKELLTKRLGQEAGHHHGVDIPTWILKKIATPIYGLAAVWDAFASTLNQAESVAQDQPKTLTLTEAWYKQTGQKKEQDVVLPVQRPSQQWQIEHTVSLIEKHQSKQLANASIGKDVADAKIAELDALKESLRGARSTVVLVNALEQAKQQPIYNQHRLFGQSGNTATQDFLEELPERVNAI